MYYITDAINILKQILEEEAAYTVCHLVTILLMTTVQMFVCLLWFIAWQSRDSILSTMYQQLQGFSDKKPTTKLQTDVLIWHSNIHHFYQITRCLSKQMAFQWISIYISHFLMVRVEAWLPTPDPWRTTLRQGCYWTVTPGMEGWAAGLCDGSLCSVNQEGVGPPSTHRPGVPSSRAPQSLDNQTGWAYTAAQTERALAEEQVGSPNLYSFLFSLHTRFLQAYFNILQT